MSWTGLNWTDQHPRFVGDLTGGGRADIVGFGNDGVYTALGIGDGTFQPPRLVSDFGGVNSGWRIDEHLRFVADLTGDGRADIVGFGNDGVYTALGIGDGTFQAPQFVLADFAPSANGWRVDRHPRFVADVTGDGRADIVGFGDDGVWVSLSNGDGTFQPAVYGLADLGYNSGWRVEQHPRFLADITGDGRADIVGFGDDGMWTALSNGAGGFSTLQLAIAGFTDWRDDQHPRFMVDITGDGTADLVGFNQQGMWTARSNGNGTFIYPGFAGDFGGSNSGWRVGTHPIIPVDVTGDRRADVVGFGDDGVWVSLGLGNGSFYPPRLVLHDFGAHSADTDTPPGFAPRTHSAGITLAPGEERLYRLPPVSRGTVIVKAFHADISTGVATAESEPLPTTNIVAGPVRPTTASTLATPQDDPGGGGPYSDTSPARNLELELRLGPTMMARHGNVVVSESPNHTNAWRLHIRRPPQLNDLTPNPGQYRIETTYVSQLPILQRRVPAIFFHDGFELNWNQQQQQYVSGYVDGSKVFIYFHEDLRQLYSLDEVSVIDTGVPLVKANNIQTTSVSLDVGAALPPPFFDTTAPYFSVRVDCAADGEIELPLLSDVKLPSFHVTVRLFLCRRGNGLEYRPVVESELLDLLADVEIPDPEPTNPFHKVNAKDKAKAAIEDAIYQLQFPSQSGFSEFGAVLAPWLIGDRRELWSIGYNAGPTDTAGADGIVEPASGELLVQYVGPKPKPSTDPVLHDPNSGPGDGPADDGSIRLYDLPDEEPDPEPDGSEPELPGGGGGGPIHPPDIGALSKIDHIVVLMMENRSFDQVLGYLSRELGRTDVNGLNTLPPDPDINPQFNRHNNRNLFPQRATSTAWPVFKGPSGAYVTGPCHETECVHNQIDGDRPTKMERFASDFARRAGDDPERLRLVMDYFGPDQLPVYAVLANEFGICDHWYTSHAGPTWPNRFVLFTGDLNLGPADNVEQDNPDFATMLPLKTPTLFDHLNDRGVSWRVFENGYSFIRLYRNYTFDTTNVVWFDDPVHGFEATARSGTLPQVTMIEPDYIDLPPGNDDHPPADMGNGQDFINRIVQALLASPQWDKTLLVITYDEHGGFYDHQKPPTNAPPLRGGFTTLGPRVPTFLVSPWIERQAVIHSRFDHTSIGATILRRFAGPRPPRVSERLDAALDLRETLTLTAPRPRSESASIGLPPLNAQRPPARRSLEARGQRIGQRQGKDDFHWLLSALRLIGGEAPR
jgi:phospholipase C